MYGFYFWLIVIVLALLCGRFMHPPKRLKSSEAPAWKRLIFAIGSPLELVVGAGFVFLLWYWGAFDGGNGTFFLGVVAMLAVPIGAVFLVFKAIGSATKLKKRDGEE